MYFFNQFSVGPNNWIVYNLWSKKCWRTDVNNRATQWQETEDARAWASCDYLYLQRNIEILLRKDSPFSNHHILFSKKSIRYITDEPTISLNCAEGGKVCITWKNNLYENKLLPMLPLPSVFCSVCTQTDCPAEISIWSCVIAFLMVVFVHIQENRWIRATNWSLCFLLNTKHTSNVYKPYRKQYTSIHVFILREHNVGTLVLMISVRADRVTKVYFENTLESRWGRERQSHHPWNIWVAPVCMASWTVMATTSVLFVC